MSKQKLGEYFQYVRRAALLVKPKQPFFDWLIKLDPEDENLLEETIEGDMYLLPDLQGRKEIERWLRKHFDEFFSEQLFGWYTDETCWVKNRTYKMFTEWFEISFCTMVWDSVEGAIEKE